MLRLALNLPADVRFRFRRPKALLKRALTRRAPAGLATRVKLGFGQPIFQWLSPGGQLRQLAERAGDHPFIDRPTMARVLRRPTWFLSSLVVYDAWHRLFVGGAGRRRGKAFRERTWGAGPHAAGSSKPR
jgi:hypothetical protein